MIESSSSNTNTALTHDFEQMIFSQRDLWYFKTQAGDHVGPFRYRSEAEIGLGRFLQEQNSKP